MKKIIFILLLVVICAFIAWFLIGCLTGGNDADIIKSPEVADARYIITVVNTGEVIYTDNVDVVTGPDASADDDSYIVHGFWEAAGAQFVYRDGSIIMNETIFGAIKLKERTK